ncbi:F35 protein [Hirschfeldia incana]|nr:F35 protein [Hirschfeldia incana]
MGHDNITRLASLLVKLPRVPSSWLCLHPRPDRSISDVGGHQRRIKLVRSDGSSELYDRPVVVSELTRDFPRHKICRSDSLYIGQKTPVLSETDTLKLGLNYFLLPSDFFTNDLSFLAIAALKPPQNGGVLIRSKSAGAQQQQQPFLIQKEGTGEKLKIRVSEEFMSELMMEGRKNKQEEEEEEEEGENEERVCTTVKLKKDYVQLVGLRKWKPKLDTIRETKATVEKKKKGKRKKFLMMKKRSSSFKDSSQSDSCGKRKLQPKPKSKIKKAILRKLA